jgi:glycosyltransferase involved in cell wall biosynthesis
MATFNGSRYIKEQLQSILPQLNGNDELILSDNGSTDDTLTLIHSLNDPRIKVVHEPKKGVIPNFENALRHAQGDIIFLADQDDVWLKNKVATVLSSLAECDLVLHDADIVDSDLHPLAPSLFQANNFQANPSAPGLIHTLIKNRYVGCCMAFRRTLLDLALPFPPGIGMHDWWLGALGEARFRVRHLPQPLIHYRRHDTNASMTSQRSKYSLLQKVKWRIVLIYFMLKRIYFKR